MIADVRCGVVIYSKHDRMIRTCGARITHNLVINGDNLFGVCPRHNARLRRAFPGMEEPERRNGG